MISYHYEILTAIDWLLRGVHLAVVSTVSTWMWLQYLHHTPYDIYRCFLPRERERKESQLQEKSKIFWVVQLLPFFHSGKLNPIIPILSQTARREGLRNRQPPGFAASTTRGGNIHSGGFDGSCGQQSPWTGHGLGHWDPMVFAQWFLEEKLPVEMLMLLLFPVDLVPKNHKHAGTINQTWKLWKFLKGHWCWQAPRCREVRLRLCGSLSTNRQELTSQPGWNKPPNPKALCSCVQALSLPSKYWTNASLSSIELSISSGGNLIVRLALFSAHEPL